MHPQSWQGRQNPSHQANYSQNWDNSSRQNHHHGGRGYAPRNPGPPYYPEQGDYNQRRDYAPRNPGQSYYPNQGNYSQSRDYSSGQYDSRGYKRGLDYEEIDRLSRELSSILRHRARDMNLYMDEGGFVRVDDILQLRKFKDANFSVIEGIVSRDRKQRFCLKEVSGQMVIRANQGHSIELGNLDLREIVDPYEFADVIHGTYYQSWQYIQTEGLKTMERNHIHFAIGLPGKQGVISGMRSSCEILIYVDMEKAMKDGIKFLLSANNVILSTGLKNIIKPEYFKVVIDYETGQRLSLTEPFKIGKASKSEISERVAARQAGILKTETKPASSIPGLNPVDTDSKKSSNKKSKKQNRKQQELEQMLKTEEPSSDKESSKHKEEYDGSISDNVPCKGSKKRKNKKHKRNIEEGSSDMETEQNHFEEETTEEKKPRMKVRNFDPSLEKKLLKLNKVAVANSGQNLLVVGNMDHVVIFDVSTDGHLEVFQKIMENPKITKLINPTNCSCLKRFQASQFQNIVDTLVVYNQMNKKPMKNSTAQEIYKKIFNTIEEPELDFDDNITSRKYPTKLATFVKLAFEIHEYYKDSLDEENIQRLSLESLKTL
ncbi:uncharacterized protein LOC115217608 [Argonauta hians]